MDRSAINDFTPLNVPNLNYAPDMYNRDSFFSIVSSYNDDLNLQIWEQWAKTQNSKGAVATIITPYMGTIEAKDNEATIQFLIWMEMVSASRILHLVKSILISMNLKPIN